MCIAVPMQILSVDGTMATIGVEGLEQRASLALVPDAGVGDWVLVHAGYAINTLAADDAQETHSLLAELGEWGAQDDPDADVG